MAKIKEKEIAQKLRYEGWSISDISLKTGVSKSTVSLWCRDIMLSLDAIDKIVSKSKSKSTTALLIYTERLRKKRQENVESDMDEGGSLVGNLSDRDIFCIGLGLYWGEGYKKGNQEFGFSNSDPSMVTFYLRWLQTVFKVEKENLILRVSINSLHRERIAEVEKFWSEHTKIDLSQFTKTSLIKTKNKKVYKNFNLHYGTLRIKVRKGTKMRRVVLGAIRALF